MGQTNRTNKAKGQHAEALTDIWRWVMALSPTAALRRRIALWLLAAAFIALLLTFRAQGSSIWLGLFTLASLGHILVTVLAFWLAINAAALVLQAIFPTMPHSDARRHLMNLVFGGRYNTLHTHGPDYSWEDDHSALAQSGGPGWLIVHLDHAAITERVDGSARVMGPSSRPVLLDGFERLRTVLHLKEQVLTLNLWARSRDGIRVRVEGARLVFSLLRGKREPTLQQPYPLDSKSAMDLVYGQLVEQSARRGLKASGANLVAEQGQAFFERQLQEFIGQFTLSELLAGPLEDSTEGLSGKLLLARDKLREAFINRSQEAAAGLGLQISWIDIGTWKLDERARSALGDHEDSVQISGHEGELANLIDQLLPDDLQQIGAAWINDALLNFAKLFVDLRDQYEELKNEFEPQLASVIRFLNLLTKQRTPKKS